PVAALGHFVAAAPGQIASAVFLDHRSDLDPVFLEFGGVGDDVLNNQVGGHVKSPGVKKVQAQKFKFKAQILAHVHRPLAPKARDAYSLIGGTYPVSPQVHPRETRLRGISCEPLSVS